jgi:CBS domain containing-hemolysin-like protein
LFALILIVLVGFEFLMERFPLKDPEDWALSLAPVASFLDILFSPIVSIFVNLQGTAASVQRNLGSVTQDELRTWVEVGEPEGGL